MGFPCISEEIECWPLKEKWDYTVLESTNDIQTHIYKLVDKQWAVLNVIFYWLEAVGKYETVT